MPKRCAWPKTELSIAYHDEEWGAPLHDDRKLFEFLILEGAQAGLSWETVLNKRDNYRAAFDQFDSEKIARYGPQKIQKLLLNPGIIRNRLKIAAAIQNARPSMWCRMNSAALTLTSGVSWRAARSGESLERRCPRKQLSPKL